MIKISELRDTENVVQVSDAAYGPLVKKAQLPGSSTHTDHKKIKKRIPF